MSTSIAEAAPVHSQDLQQLAADIVASAMRAGATDAEVVIREGDEFSTLVRLGQVDTLKESGSRGVGLRVFLWATRRQHLFERSVSRKESSISSPGPSLSLASPPKIPSPDSPKPAAFGQLTGELDLYYEDVYSLPGDQRIDYARRAEAAALAADTRIQNSDGGSFDAATGRKILANSRGFVGDYRRSYASISAVPIAQSQDGQMQRDYWYSSAPHSDQARIARVRRRRGRASHCAPVSTRAAFRPSAFPLSSRRRWREA